MVLISAKKTNSRRLEIRIANGQLLCSRTKEAESKGVEVGVVDWHVTCLTFM